MDNSMAPHTTAFLGIAQVLNGTGTYRFLNLKSLNVLTANHFTHAPMNQDAINLLNALALKYGRHPQKTRTNTNKYGTYNDGPRKT